MKPIVQMTEPERQRLAWRLAKDAAADIAEWRDLPPFGALVGDRAGALRQLRWQIRTCLRVAFGR